MQSFLRKNVSPYYRGRGGDTMLYFHSFPFLKVSSLTFVLQTMVFQAKLPGPCVFKLMQYGYEIFQTVLNLNRKII